MGLVIFDGNIKSTVPLDNKTVEKIDLVKTQNENSESTIVTKNEQKKKKIKKLKKENEVFIDSLKIGSGFKIIPKIN